MSKTTDDNTAVAFLYPLHSYTRTAAVTAQLTELSPLSKSAILRQASNTDTPLRLERETLVALVRGFERSGDREAADRVLEILIRRVSGTIKGIIAGWPNLTPEDRTDCQQQMVAHLCEEVRKLTPGAEFWECNLTTALEWRLISVWHKWNTARVLTVSLVQENAAGVTYDAMASVADTRDTFAEIDVSDMVQTLSRRQPKIAEAIFLRMSGYPDEEIAGRLGITSRTLRNWMAQARTLWERETTHDNT